MFTRMRCVGTSGEDMYVTSLDAFASSSGTPKGWEAGVELGTDGGTVTSGPVDGPIQDWSGILALWNLDPEQFEVVEPALFKAWDGYAKEENEDGTSKLVSKRLFSYKASIRRRSPHQIKSEVIAEWRQSLLKAKPFAAPKRRRGEDVSYVVLVADPQLGKERTHEAKANWERGILGHAERVSRLVDEGYNVEVVAAFMGDEIENVADNYGNQPHTIELNQSEQLLLDFDLTMWTLKTLFPLAPRRRVTSVRSNHGEWTRKGSKEPVTAARDNASTFTRMLAQRTIGEIPQFDDVVWNIADHGPHVSTELSGVKVFFSHFYEQKGRGSSTEVRTRSAIERQIIGRTEELGDCKIFFTAHHHHFYCQEWEGRTQFGCPALEAEKSSGYMLNQYGVWSRPGMLGIIVGDSVSPHGWTEPVII